MTGIPGPKVRGQPAGPSRGVRERPARRPRRDRPRTRLPGRSLRTRLLVFIGVTLVTVCAAMALATAFIQRACLLDGLDDRVGDAAERSLVGASLRPQFPADLAFLDDPGQPAGLLAARLDGDGDVVSAEVVRQGTDPQPLDAGQRAALAGVGADGSMHTRTVPGLGGYRVGVLEAGGVRVLTGLPTADVERTTGRLVLVESAVAGVGLTVAGCVCAVVVRRQLRPLGRVAATAVEVSRAPLGHGEVTHLARVPAPDTDPGSEAGQVGAALNRMIDHVEASLAERRRSEEQIRRSEERMRRFLADASHELRTPLTSIAGYAELMSRGTGLVDPPHAWRRVSAESARMTGLVEDLLLLARLDEGRPPESAEVDLAGLVAEAVWDARAAGGGAYDWQLELQPDTPASVLGDAVGLRRLVTVLLANARAHTPPGTRVVARVETSGTGCVIRVRDNGPGVPEELLPTVFERFTRADASRARAEGGRGGGSGLGLAVAAAITAAHGGRIGVESVPGRTEFRVELPGTGPTDVRAAALPRTGTAGAAAAAGTAGAAAAQDTGIAAGLPGPGAVGSAAGPAL
ncbi:ATP-binding protein [Streptomyces sp. NPDC047000]|uniref:ATP-binding protein n=1 Tax=Streptomyces sp. NPDC047000 TaxID=3155474 RepID=UPI003403CF48